MEVAETADMVAEAAATHIATEEMGMLAGRPLRDSIARTYSAVEAVGTVDIEVEGKR